MSRITQIKSRICQLGAGEFQNLADALLTKIGAYGKIQSLGMEPGTSKTTKGTPDTFFVKENGHFVFAEYTAQQGRIYEKLKSDIEKCIDRNKTGIPLDKIDEIVCCHTSSNLKPSDHERLHGLFEDKGIKLEIFTDHLSEEKVQSVYCVHLPIDFVYGTKRRSGKLTGTLSI